MSRQTRSHTPQRARPQAARVASPLDIWRSGGALPEVEPVSIPDDVSALARSLGDPPMHRGSTAGKYFESVIERAAAVARALALSADLLAADDD